MRLRLAVVLWLAAATRAAVPSPQSHFGHAIGADRTVLDWDRVVSYLRSLEASSDRILVRELGKSTDGRPLVAAFLSAPDTLRRLDHYRRIQEKLSDPRLTPPDEAEALFSQGKAVVMITCSIHATELASTHTAVEFAFRLLTETSPKLRAILDNVILLLVPSLNPDGVDLVAGWYRRTLGTPFEGTDPPELYHRYTGHDNNRDWYFFTQRETRLVVSLLHNVWRPQITYDVHQMGPHGARIFVPPWIDPIDPNIDPLIVQQCNSFGAGMAADLTAAGKRGVVVNAMYDFWSPSRHYSAYHGGLRILSESASAKLATPAFVRPDQLDHEGHGYNARTPGWNHPEPWPGGHWRLRDIIDYQLIAWESLLWQAAVRREDLLRNFYRIGARAVERAAPYAFVVPAAQRDPGAARKLLETLAFGMVEIERTEEDFAAGSKRYPTASHIIPLRQPYGAFAKTLLERQRYPDLRQYPGGPPRRPYDVTAHTLPLLLGVAVDAIEAPFEKPGAARMFPAAPPDLSALPAADTDSWRVLNRWWDSGKRVWRDLRTGDFYRSSGEGRKPVRRLRVGVYRSRVPNMDEGWTRWVLEEFGFRYASVTDLEVRAGALRQSYDLIVFPDQRPAEIQDGFKPGTMPPEFCGGLGQGGAAALGRFVDDGGTLVFLNRSAGYAIDALGLGLKNVTAGLKENEFFSPGSLVWAEADTRHPLALGLPERIAIWSQGSPAWEVPRDAAARVVLRYPDKDLLASGWLLGESYIAGKAALVEVTRGQGRVILFGLRPQYRGQSYQTFKLLFNALVE